MKIDKLSAILKKTTVLRDQSTESRLAGLFGKSIIVIYMFIGIMLYFGANVYFSSNIKKEIETSRSVILEKHENLTSETVYLNRSGWADQLKGDLRFSEVCMSINSDLPASDILARFMTSLAREKTNPKIKNAVRKALNPLKSKLGIYYGVEHLSVDDFYTEFKKHLSLESEELASRFDSLLSEGSNKEYALFMEKLIIEKITQTNEGTSLRVLKWYNGPLHMVIILTFLFVSGSIIVRWFFISKKVLAYKKIMAREASDEEGIQELYACAAEKYYYSFIRTIIGILPSLGFLGTVYGMSEALGFVGGLADEANRSESIQGMSVNLGSAFSTTLLALTYFIIAEVLLLYLFQKESNVVGSLLESK